MSKVSMTADQLRALWGHSQRVGTAEHWPALALDWADAAQAHGEALAAELAAWKLNCKDACDKLTTAEARLAEAELILVKLRNYSPSMYREMAHEARCEIAARAAVSASAVQPERCCLDYPRCDCNSPPEPDNAPALQPCGHPWKAQHDSKCILCSSPGDATYAQLAEAQRFPHGAAAGCNHFPGQVNCEWCTEPERATQPVEPNP